MDLWVLIGNVSLNSSFVLYLIVYIPQILHNRKTANIAELSLWLHSLLYVSYLFDLFYGFATHLPWQYKTVSIIGLSLVTVQHLQLIKFFISHQRHLLLKLSYIFLILNCIAMYYFFVISRGALESSTALYFGSIARGCGLLYCLPQILKNKRTKSAKAISLYFVYLNFTLAFLDTISSWCLDWGWPNKLAAPVSMTLMMVIFLQNKKYAKIRNEIESGHVFNNAQ